jgi:tripartite-type tricarboxylate transporter receptor subunit TctC
MAPAKTPDAVAGRLHAELTAIAATQEMRAQAIKLGMVPVTSPSLAQLKGFLPEQIARWGKLVRQAGIAGSE